MRLRIVQTNKDKFVVQRRFLGFYWRTCTEVVGYYAGAEDEAIVFDTLEAAEFYIKERRAEHEQKLARQAEYRAGGYPKVVKDPA